MLYLAQVKNSLNQNNIDLQLIAQQQTNFSWQVCQKQTISLSNYNFLNEGVLVLVNLGQEQEIIDIKEAKDWILEIINNYLNSDNISLEKLEQQKQEIEEWRRELTAQSQEITQTRLELETRLEQLQELEENLNNMIQEHRN